MGFRSSIFILVTVLVLGHLVSGCVSFRCLRRVEGQVIVPPSKKLQLGRTTLEDALSLLGAPDNLLELKGKDLLIYERTVYRQNTFSLGIPVFDILWPSVDLAAYGTLVRYDRLVLFFTPDGVLQNVVFEKGSNRPYMKALFADE